MLEQQEPRGGSGLVQLIASAQEGSPAALGQLLEQCRDYLLLVADQELDTGMRAMIGPSDLVQETFVQAQRSFVAFRGQTEAELLGWLRAVLVNRRLTAYRRYRKAAVLRVDPESARHQPAEIARHVTTDSPSPSEIASLTEQTATLERSLRQLPNDYERVIRLRYWEQLPFVEIGPLMGRSADAARKLWFRAVDLLGQLLEKGNGP